VREGTERIMAQHRIEKSYKYQIGVQFAPYGRQKGENPPALLEITALEERFKG
jgi:hypothetical protein